MTAKVTISIEVELGWGVHDKTGSHKYDHLSSNRVEETKYLGKTLDLCDKYDVPVTFDIVGHLFLTECDGEHRPAPTPSWYDEDPGTSVDADPLFYAPDLVEMIRGSSVKHDIGTHTFSHVLCDETGKSVLQWELKRTNELIKAAGFEKATSIVTPRHRFIPDTVLQDTDIRVRRKPLVRIPESPIQKFFWFLLREPQVKAPENSNGIVTSYASHLESLTSPMIQEGQRSTHWTFKMMPLSIRKKLQERYLRRAIEEAIEEDTYVHFWSHLYNLSNYIQFSFLETLCSLLEEHEDDIEIVTMAGLTRETERCDND